MNCNDCKVNLNTAGFLCISCKYFGLCGQCFSKNEHRHKLKNAATFVSLNLPKDQAHAGVDFPIRQFVEGMCYVFCSMTGSQQSISDPIFSHMFISKLLCNCVLCKQMAVIYINHLKLCQTPGCSFKSCPFIRSIFDRRILSDTLFRANTIQKLIGVRMALENAYASASRITPAVTPETIDTTPAPILLNRKFAILRCIRMLEHAYRCTDADCMPLSCQKMKRVLGHIKICKRKITGGCPICKQVCALCCFHAKNCSERKCSVLLCMYIKRRMKAFNAAKKK